MYVFSYFTEHEEKLFLAESEDGYTWRPRDDGQAIFASMHLSSMKKTCKDVSLHDRDFLMIKPGNTT
jgi:hypothetical protein